MAVWRVPQACLATDTPNPSPAHTPPTPVPAEGYLGAAQLLLPCVQGMGQGASYIWEVA